MLQGSTRVQQGYSVMVRIQDLASKTGGYNFFMLNLEKVFPRIRPRKYKKLSIKCTVAIGRFIFRKDGFQQFSHPVSFTDFAPHTHMRWVCGWANGNKHSLTRSHTYTFTHKQTGSDALTHICSRAQTDKQNRTNLPKVVARES